MCGAAGRRPAPALHRGAPPVPCVLAIIRVRSDRFLVVLPCGCTSWHVLRQEAPTLVGPEHPPIRASTSSSTSSDQPDRANQASGPFSWGESGSPVASGARGGFLAAAGLDDLDDLFGAEATDPAQARTALQVESGPRQETVLQGGARASRPPGSQALCCRLLAVGEAYEAEDEGVERAMSAAEERHVRELERAYIAREGEIPTSPASGVAAGGEAEAYEATPAPIKAMLRFQSAMRDRPHNALRFGPFPGPVPCRPSRGRHAGTTTGHNPSGLAPSQRPCQRTPKAHRTTPPARCSTRPAPSPRPQHPLARKRSRISRSALLICRGPAKERTRRRDKRCWKKRRPARPRAAQWYQCLAAPVGGSACLSCS